jgi:hypothetical protein
MEHKDYCKPVQKKGITIHDALIAHSEYVAKLEQDNKSMLHILNTLLINQAIACNYVDRVAKVIEQVEKTTPR